MDDELANKYINKADAGAALESPADEDITTLFIGGVPPSISAEDLKDKFYSYGEVRSVNFSNSGKSAQDNASGGDGKRAAFVTFAARSQAEAAAQELFNNLNVKGERLSLRWARPSTSAGGGGGGGMPGAAPVQPSGDTSLAGMSQPYYPSQDPSNRGSRMD